MRLLLTAIRCDKQDVDANVRRHLELLAQATSEGCDLAVFPEMSLTGYVAAAHDVAHVALDDPIVESIVAATDAGAGAAFGIVEPNPDGAPFITQVVAARGAILAVQRKRFLGEGEDDYAPAAGDALAEVAGHRLGVAICAEGDHDEPFDAAAAAGASIVLYCAAPGLTGRRTTDDEWRAGWEWWRGESIGQAVRHATRCGVWIALSSQAGATHDEDFPGIAALVSPAGEVVAETPAWHEATLVVDATAGPG